MNWKATHYAFSRMLLPTITVIVLSLFWSLDPIATFKFFFAKEMWSGVLRIFLLLCETGWFSYLYYNYNLDNPNSVEINYYKTNYQQIRETELYNFIRQKCKYSYDKIHIAKCTNDNTKFVLTLTPCSSY